MKRRNRQPSKKRKLRGQKHPKAIRRISRRKQRPARRKKLVLLRKRNQPTNPRIAQALGLMRREGTSASKAARLSGMKLNTFRKGAGRFLYRSGPGKPWKARSEDQLRFSMTVLTSLGPIDVMVPNSRERKLLHRYDLALRMFRGGEDGAEAALKTFEGVTVGGHTLITDVKLLVDLEQAGLLDYDTFYSSVGAGS